MNLSVVNAPALNILFNRLIVECQAVLEKVAVRASKNSCVPAFFSLDGLSKIFTAQRIFKVEFRAEKFKTEPPFYEFLKGESVPRFYFRIFLEYLDIAERDGKIYREKRDSTLIFDISQRDFKEFQFYYDNEKRELTIEFVYFDTIDISEATTPQYQLLEKFLKQNKINDLKGNEQADSIVLRYDDEEDWDRVKENLWELQKVAKKEKYLKIQNLGHVQSGITGFLDLVRRGKYEYKKEF